MTPPRLVFVLSPYQNAFFPEIVEALVDALGTIGVEAVSTSEPGDHAVTERDVFVLTPPHEYVALEGRAFVDDPVVAARTVGLSAEQPHQSFFASNAQLGSALGAVLDFSADAVDAYRRAGVDAHHLHFGYTPLWDRTQHGRRRDPVTIPALYLGNKRPRRLAMLAEAGDALVRAGATLVVSDNDEPNSRTTPSFYAGDDKRDLLASTGLLINIHQSDEPYFEWLRFVEATHCGTPVLTEPGHDSAPFRADDHYATFTPGTLSERLGALVDERCALDEMAARAYATLRERPLAESVVTLVDVAGGLLDASPPPALPARTRTQPIGRSRLDPVPARMPSMRRLARRLSTPVSRRRSPVLVAPDGTITTAAPDLLAADDADMTILMAAGADVDGAPMLEGLWPWEPWRLLHGQHLGRVLIADERLVADAQRRLPDPALPDDLLPDDAPPDPALPDPALPDHAPPADALRDHPHLLLQLYAALHGLRVGHVPRPVARLAVPVDASQQIPPALVDRCRSILLGPGTGPPRAR